MATVEITLYNIAVSGHVSDPSNMLGDSSYKGSLYGNEITIIRKIWDNGGSSYRIRGDKGVEENLTHNELDSILLHFNIQPYNPVCILSQDTARCFFRLRDKKQMYQLFMRGTQLESVKTSYVHNKNQLHQLLKENEEQGKELEKICKDVIEADKLQEISVKMKEAEEKKKFLRREHSWVLVKHWKLKCEETAKKVEELEKKYEEFLQNQEEFGSEKLLLAKKTSLQGDVLNMKGEVSNLNLELKAVEDAISNHMENLKGKKNNLASNRLRMTNTNENIRTLEAAIADIMSGNSNLVQQRQKIDAFVKEISELDAIIKTSEWHINQLDSTVNQYEKKLMEFRNEDISNSGKLQEIEKKLKHLREGKSLAVFGPWMPAAIDAINNAHKNGMFQVKPYGPIGFYIKVVDAEWVATIETLLKSFLSSFCVASSQDKKVLDSVIRKVSSGRNPDTIVGRFVYQVYDTSRREVRHDQYQSLLRAISGSDPVVTNVLIDQMGIEQILLVPDNESAYSLMSDVRQVPRNCQYVVTKSGDTIYPAPNYRFYGGHVHQNPQILQQDSSLQIRNLEAHKANCKSEIEKYKESKIQFLQEYRKLQKSLADKTAELTASINKRKRLHDARDELERNLPFEPSNIEIYKSEIQELNIKKENATTIEKTLTKEIEEISCKIREHEQMMNEFNMKKTEFLRKENSLNENIQKIDAEIRDWTQRKTRLAAHANELQGEIQESKTELKDSTDKYNIHQNKALQEHGSEVPTTRSLEEVNADLKRLNVYLKTFEKELGGTPQQVTDNYRLKKRLYEEKKNTLSQLRLCIQKTQTAMENELVNYSKISIANARIAKRTFGSLMLARHFIGKLRFDDEQQRLDVYVVPNVQGNQENENISLNSLSGGERSYATTAFIRAIWSCMSSPFYVLDEFDVFTDVTNRTQIIDLLIDHAKQNRACQYIFITPQDLSRIDTSDPAVKICHVLDLMMEYKPPISPILTFPNNAIIEIDHQDEPSVNKEN